MYSILHGLERKGYLRSCEERVEKRARRVYTVTSKGRRTLEHGKVKVRSSYVVLSAEDPAEFVTLEEMDRRYILRVLEAVGGSRSLAAKTLGLDRTTLWRRLERYGVGNPKKP